MMEKELLAKRERLEKEIKVAQDLLMKNLEGVKLGNYIGIDGGSLPGLLKGLLSNPSKTIAKGDMVARNILPSNNIFRKIIKYFSLLSRGINLLIQK